MYAVLSVFPDSFPLFLRERKANLYGAGQFYIAQIIAMVSSSQAKQNLFLFCLTFSDAICPTGIYIVHTDSVLLGTSSTNYARIDVHCFSFCSGDERLYGVWMFLLYYVFLSSDGYVVPSTI